MSAGDIFLVLGIATVVYTVGFVIAEKWHRRRSALADLADRLTDGVVR